MTGRSGNGCDNRLEMNSSSSADAMQVISKKIEIDKKISENMAIFPWEKEFERMSRILILEKTALIKYLCTLKRNVNLSVNECYEKPLEVIRLKKIIEDALLYCIEIYQSIKIENENDEVLEHISDLLAVYIDLELVASKQQTEQWHGETPEKISLRLGSYLLKFTDKKPQYALDTLLKLQKLENPYYQIVDLVFSKLMKTLPLHPKTEIMYVRYFLAYSLWKQIQSDSANREKINALAILSLGSVPTKMPKALLKVLPATANPPSSEAYLHQDFDLKKACSRFFKFCRPAETVKGTDLDGKNTERDQRLKSTLTSETNKVESVNTKFSKSSNSNDKVNFEQLNIPLEKMKINNEKASCSLVNCSDSVNNKLQSPLIRKPKNRDTIIIDLTGEEEVTKIIKHREEPNRTKWVAQARRNLLAKRTAWKEEQLKKKKELESNSTIVENSISNLDDSKSMSDLVCNDKQEIAEETQNCTKAESKVDSMSVTDCSVSKSISVTSPKVLNLQDEEEKISALSEDRLSKDEQSADCEMSNVEMQEDKPSETETVAAASISCSVIRSPASTVATPSIIVNNEQKVIIENVSVNSNVTKTDYYPNEQKVQQTIIKERDSLTNISERHHDVETELTKEEEKERSESVHSEQVNDPNVTQMSHISHTSRSIDHGQFESSIPELPSTSSNFYTMQESELDGLTLLASISAQRQVSINDKVELKVKPYSSLQSKANEDSNNSVTKNVVEVYPESNVNKEAFQADIPTTSSIVPGSVNKYEPHPDSTPEVLSYFLDQNNLENHENAKVILNGETIMLFQKSPNSNLYIINKAECDSKANYYNAEEEDVKYSQQAMVVKYQFDSGTGHGKAMKVDQDYADIRNHPRHLAQAYEAHYAGYPAQPLNGYCTYPQFPRPSQGGPYFYYPNQYPYYTPAPHATPLVQTNPAVQDMKVNKMEPIPAMAMPYEEQPLVEADENHVKSEQQEEQQVTVEKEEAVACRFEPVAIKLPLKKRYSMAAHMREDFDSVERPVQPPVRNEEQQQAAASYPGMLMMSIADVAVQDANPPLVIGANVEVSSSSEVNTNRNCGWRSERTANSRAINLNPSEPAIRKNNGRKRTLTPTIEETENKTIDGGSKKSKKNHVSNGKQTRSSRRTVPAVNYVYAENDYDSSPSAKRRKKRSR